MAFRRRIPLRGPWALVVGAVFLGIACYQYLTSSALAERGVIATATVISVSSKSSSSGGYGRRKYALTLEYRDRDGDQHRERTGYDRALGSYHRGDAVRIRYNPARPEEFRVDGFRGMWLQPLMFGAVGVLACGAFLFGPRRT